MLNRFFSAFACIEESSKKISLSTLKNVLLIKTDFKGLYILDYK